MSVLPGLRGARVVPLRPAAYEDPVADLLALLAGDRSLSWQDFAACAETDPEAFFPEKGSSARDARRICRACPVRAACLDYALETDQGFGIWGGTSERERRRLKRSAA